MHHYYNNCVSRHNIREVNNNTFGFELTNYLDFFINNPDFIDINKDIINDIGKLNPFI